MNLSGLNLHPVLSSTIRAVVSADVSRVGLRGDREWMIVDGGGAMLSARGFPQLFRIVADTPQTLPEGAGEVRWQLRLTAQGHPDLELGYPVGAPMCFKLFAREVWGVPAGAPADQWVRDVIGRRDLRLIWCPAPPDAVATPLASALTVTSTASLRQVHAWLSHEAEDRGESPQFLPVERFRANLVIDGALEPFAEDSWQRIRVGDVEFDVTQSLGRCVLTAAESTAANKGRDPIHTPARNRRRGADTVFCSHLTPLTEGTVRLGDPVTVLN